MIPVAWLLCSTLASACAQDEKKATVPEYLEDRGPGIPTSLFGTYVKEKEVLLYLFYEFTYDHDTEYNPRDFGAAVNQDFQGRFREHEELIFLGYGVTDWLAVEIEGAYIRGELDKDPRDPSSLPGHLRQYGFDLETQVRARFLKETEALPDVYGFFETDFPIDHKNLLIGSKDWVFGIGAGAIKGFSWGTLAVRIQFEYSREDGKLRFDEYEVEYLKKLSDSFRVVVGIEGVQSELEFITELQWQLSPHVTLKINNAIGLTSGAPDWAPEIGIVISF